MQPKISLIELSFEVTMADKLVNAVHESMVAMLEDNFCPELDWAFCLPVMSSVPNSENRPNFQVCCAARGCGTGTAGGICKATLGDL